MSSAEPQTSPDHAELLLSVARRSIEGGLATGEPLPFDAADHAPALCEIRATFVTLHLHERLRGCVGGLEATRPLVDAVAHSAFAAAFRDPRFAPVSADECSDLEIHISILSPLQPLPVRDEAELLRALRPGVDGVVLRDGHHQGTFLPAVWESLRDPRDFVRELKHKAQLPRDGWSSAYEVFRYTVTSVPP